ncbi:sugar-binding domain-containing protein [Persicitalea sp.]|uniref:sugar-binding domain-containing protein n=1 Tax=Persicitalea sp. TaxID=3100273 RepID=UPI003594554E
MRKNGAYTAFKICLVLFLYGTGSYAQSVIDAVSINSFNGDWNFRTDPNDIGEAQGWYKKDFSPNQWDTMNVPGNWDLRNEYAHYVGKAWYHKRFIASSAWKDKIVRIVFEAVYNQAKVWLNGRLLGENHIGFFPFEFEVSKYLVYDKPNVLVVSADNTFRRGALWNWGGIRRPVTLEVTDPLRFVRQHITAVPDLEKGTAKVAVRIFYQNHSDQATEAKGTLQLSAEGEAVGAPLAFRFQVPAGSVESTVVSAVLAKEEVHLWHFDDPFLYESSIQSTQANGTVTKSKPTRFGIRKIEVNNEKYQFKLNGESVRLIGYNLVPDDRTNGNTFPEWRYKEDIDLMKQAGANLCRVSHLPLSEAVLDYLDERGLMTFEEVSLWGYDTMADTNDPLPKEWLNRLINKEYNHPAIVGWSIGNEIGHNPSALKYVEGAIADAHRQDSTRLAIVVSHTATQPNDIIQFSDLGAINKYSNNLGPITRRQHELYPNKTLFYTEFGAGQLSENLDVDIEASALVDSLRYYPYLVGGSLWTFNDYRSAFFGTKELSENRPWGIVDVYRQKKRAYASMRKEFAPIRNLAVGNLMNASAKVIITPRGKLDLPAFTLRNYHLVWQILDQKGQSLQADFTKIPTTRPGDSKQNFDIKWQVETNVTALKIELVSPTNYAVYDTTLYFQKPAEPTIKAALTFRTVINSVPPNSGAVRVYFDKIPSATEYKLKYGIGNLSKGTAATINNYLEIDGLVINENYRIALVAINPKGETNSKIQTVKIISQLPPPVIQYDEVKDRGFSVGYGVSNDDYFYRIQVTEKASDYTNAKTVQTTNPGTLHVTGLENGKTYYYRLQSMRDNYALGEWSPERSITPDGGLPLPPTKIKATVPHGDELLIIYEPVKKATGYAFQYRKIGKQPQAWQTVEVASARTEHLFIRNLDPKAKYEVRVKK